MAPKNIKPLIDMAKEHGPKAGKFLYNNAGKIGAAYTAAQGAKKILEENRENKIDDGKFHYRKERFIEFNKTIMKNLDEYDREELLNYKLEVKQFIEQIDLEMAQGSKAKKPLHTKRRKNWESLLVQIDGKLKTKNYREYLKIYNNSEYTSAYFAGSEANVDKFKELAKKADSDAIIKFLISQTDMDTTTIKNDFLL